MFKKKNYKIILGIIVGIIISVTGVYAATYYGTAADLTYDNTTSGLSSSNVQDALDELYEMKENINCPEGYVCEKFKTTASDLELGDYILYTPTVASYPTDTDYTGYSSSQTIYPNELTLWRVLSKNADGSVEIISEYVSSTNVYFSGQKGYLNFVGYLNLLAKQYETEGITVTSRSRHFGYNGQTEYLNASNVAFTNPPPITSTTIDNSNESIGGGDILYEKDYNDVNTVLGTRIAYKVGTTTATKYWMASRYYSYKSPPTYFYWNGRTVYASGVVTYSYLYYYNGDSSDWGTLRPIVTLKSGLQYTGLGTIKNPVEIVTS